MSKFKVVFFSSFIEIKMISKIGTYTYWNWLYDFLYKSSVDYNVTVNNKTYKECFTRRFTPKFSIFNLSFCSHFIVILNFKCFFDWMVYVPINTAKPNSSVSSIPCLAKWRHVWVYTSRTRLFASTRK